MTTTKIAPRVSADVEAWLSKNFKSKCAGAEFILPWVINQTRCAMVELPNIITGNGIEAMEEVIQANYTGRTLDPRQCRPQWLAGLAEGANLTNSEKHSLQDEIFKLSDVQALALVLQSLRIEEAVA